MRVGEKTLGDHLRPLGVRTALVGKTHMIADREGMQWLCIDPDSDIGVSVAECGFEPFDRDDGMHPEGYYDVDPRYDDYLREQGYGGANPWELWANSAEGENGELLSGWLLENSGKRARLPEEHTETPYMTRRCIEFIESAVSSNGVDCGAKEILGAYAGNFDGVLEGEKDPFLCPFLWIHVEQTFAIEQNAALGDAVDVLASNDAGERALT